YWRHAPAIREGFARSWPLIAARAATSSRRALTLKTSRNAFSMVSLMVTVESARWTAAKSSSLISTLIFPTDVFLLARQEDLMMRGEWISGNDGRGCEGLNV